MNRYYKKVYMPDTIKRQLKTFNDSLNAFKFKYTPHSIDNIKNRCYDIKSMLYFISNLILSDEDIFEVYEFDNTIVRACYRIEYKDCDIILVLNEDKTIITIYANSKEDNHITLNKNLYARA